MLITLTTDFGLRDPFVGLMKGVIQGIAPGCVMVDLTHEIPPQNVAAGGMAIETALDAFPAGTVHLGVVDPGVGSQRRAVAIEIEAGFLVGPDNGLFTAALAKSPLRRAVHLTNSSFHRQPVSATFQGRDIFAPAAAAWPAACPWNNWANRSANCSCCRCPTPWIARAACKFTSWASIGSAISLPT